MAAPGMLKADNSQFDLARRRAQSETNAQVQQQRDALQRRAAQTGGGVSGALIKQEQMAQEAGAKRLADVNEGIDAQAAQERMRINEINTGREYQTSERMAGQKFASGEAALQRKFQTGERLGAQDFSAKQAGIQRDWQTGERVAGQDFARGERLGSQDFAADQSRLGREFQADQASLERMLRRDAMTIQSTQFGQQLQLMLDQFEHEKTVDLWNKDLADRIQHSNTHSSGGFLGQTWERWTS